MFIYFVWVNYYYFLISIYFDVYVSALLEDGMKFENAFEIIKSLTHERLLTGSLLVF